MFRCCSTHNLYELSVANGASSIVRVFASVPLMPATVAKHDLSPLGWFEVLAPGRHSALPGLLISGEGSNAETECEASCSQRSKSHRDDGDLRLFSVLSLRWEGPFGRIVKGGMGWRDKFRYVSEPRLAGRGSWR